MLNAMAFTVVLLAGLGLFLYQVWRRFNLLRAASGDFTLDRIPERIRAMLVYAFGQEKFIRPEVAIVRERTAGWLHFFVFWGFIILGLQIVTMFGRAFSSDFYPFPFTPSLLGPPYWFVRDIFEVTVFVCVVILIARWAITQPAASVRVRAGRGAPPASLPLGGLPDPRLHRHDHASPVPSTTAAA